MILKADHVILGFTGEIFHPGPKSTLNLISLLEYLWVFI